jgi:hypothetical protein
MLKAAVDINELTPSLDEAVAVQQAAVHRATRKESYCSSWYLCPATMPTQSINTAVLVIAGWRPQPALRWRA